MAERRTAPATGQKRPFCYTFYRVSDWSFFNLQFRIRFCDDKIYFVPIEKPPTILASVFRLFTAPGIIGMHQQTLEEEKAAGVAVSIDNEAVENLLTRFGGSFALTPDDFTDCRIDPPGMITGFSDVHVGRWMFRTTDKRSFEFKIGQPRDARELEELLRSLFGDRLTMNAEWDPEYQRYRKRKRG